MKHKPFLLVFFFVFFLFLVSDVSLKAEDKIQARSPRRIVSLAPSVTEILFELELGEKIVGVTSFCNYPEQAKSKAKVGGFYDPSLEAVVSLRPDLVIGISNLGNQRVIHSLNALNISTLIVKSFSIEGILESILTIGKETGTEFMAEKLVDGLRERIEKIKTITGKAKKPRVLFVFSYEPLIVAGRETLADDLITYASGENIVRDVKGRYSRYSMEEIIFQRPEIIITAAPMNISSPAKDFPKMKGWEKWKDIPAVKSKRIYPINEDVFFRPGPRIVLALERMAEMIHPELFKKKGL